MLPKMPETKPAEGGGGTRRNGGRQWATPSIAKLESGHRRDAKTGPKGAGEAASKQEVADGLKRTAAERAEAIRGGEDLLFEEIGTNLNAPEHAKPSEEFHALGGVALPDKFRKGGRHTAMQAEFVESREMQPAVTRRAAREGAVIGRGGELNPLDRSAELTELASGSGGEAGSERKIKALTEHTSNGGIGRQAVGEELRHGDDNRAERKPGVTPESGAHPVADADSGDAAVQGEQKAKP
jgi:hypothetical protein